eukprot:COSAG01_NODE_46179_length_402_cov_1.062706_2_plen_24_part_01
MGEGGGGADWLKRGPRATPGAEPT